MATSKKEEVEILSPEVVEEINQKIETSLVTANITETIIAGLRENYLPLKINGQEDKEGFMRVQEARKDCKKLRVEASKLFKKGRAEANAIAAAWIAKEKDVTGRIGEVEDYLEGMETEYETERDRRKQIEAQRLEQQGIARAAHMLGFGAVLVAGNWVLGDISYESVLVKDCDDDIYQGIYEQYKAIFDESERVKKGKEEKDRQEREEFQRQQDDLKRQQQESKDMRTQGRILLLKSLGMGAVLTGNNEAFAYSDVIVWLRDIEEKNSSEWEVILSDAKEGIGRVKEGDKERERIRNLFADRLPRLKEWSSNGHYVYAKGRQWGTVEDIVNKSEEEFEELVKENNAYLRDRDRQLEIKRQHELENARLEGIGKSRRGMLEVINGASGLSDLELGSVPAEQWDRDLKIATHLHEKKKKEGAEKVEQERQQLLGEKGRYEEYIEALKKIPIPDFRSGQYRAKIGPIKAFIDGLK